METLKGKILSRAKTLSTEAGGKGSAKVDLNNQRNTFQDIVAFIEVLVFSFSSKSCLPLFLQAA